MPDVEKPDRRSTKRTTEWILVTAVLLCVVYAAWLMLIPADKDLKSTAPPQKPAATSSEGTAGSSNPSPAR